MPSSLMTVASRYSQRQVDLIIRGLTKVPDMVEIGFVAGGLTPPELYWISNVYNSVFNSPLEIAPGGAPYR